MDSVTPSGFLGGNLYCRGSTMLTLFAWLYRLPVLFRPFRTPSLLRATRCSLVFLVLSGLLLRFRQLTACLCSFVLSGLLLRIEQLTACLRSFVLSGLLLRIEQLTACQWSFVLSGLLLFALVNSAVLCVPCPSGASLFGSCYLCCNIGLSCGSLLGVGCLRIWGSVCYGFNGVLWVQRG